MEIDRYDHVMNTTLIDVEALIDVIEGKSRYFLSPPRPRSKRADSSASSKKMIRKSGNDVGGLRREDSVSPRSYRRRTNGRYLDDHPQLRIGKTNYIEPFINPYGTTGLGGSFTESIEKPGFISDGPPIGYGPESPPYSAIYPPTKAVIPYPPTMVEATPFATTGVPSSLFPTGGQPLSAGVPSSLFPTGGQPLSAGLPSSTTFKLQKNFYKPPVKEVISAEAFRKEKNVIVKMPPSVTEIPPPILSLTDENIPAPISKNLVDAGFREPTPIQAQGWSIGLSGYDVIGIAATGGGKTLSYSIPGLTHVLAQPRVRRGEGPIMLVLAPTHELANQIFEVITRYSAGTAIKSTCLFGGVPYNDQLKALRDGVDVVVATTGRLLALLESNATNLNRATYLVLDEADTMLDMGFEKEIRKIIKQMRTDRQTMLWSATWPESIRKLANDFLVNPVTVQTTSGQLTASPLIKQHVIIVDQKSKDKALNDILMKHKGQKILIFVGKKYEADNLASKINATGIPTLSIHGDRTQEERSASYEAFKTGKVLAMVATDVAARGLDVKDIMVVVNYDFPDDIAKYVQRIGRTAHHPGSTGDAYSLFTKADAEHARELIKVMQEAKQEIPADLNTLVKGGKGLEKIQQHKE